MPITFSKDQLMMHGIWRKAFREGGLTLKMPSRGDAVKLRFALYNSVRPVRQGKVIDEELLQAASDCVIGLSGEIVTIERKVDTPMMQAVAAVLGGGEGEGDWVSPGSPLTPDEAEMQESQRKLLERLSALEKGEESPAPPAVHNPYPTRNRG